MATSAPDSTTIHLDPAISSKLILIPAKVNGQGPYQFILDTGNAGEVILTPELAKSLGLTMDQKIEDVYNVGLETEAAWSSISSLDIGDIHLGKTKVGVSAAISQVGKQLKLEIGGNLGYDFLKHYAVTLDMKKQELTLSSGGKVTGGQEFELANSMNLIMVDVLVNGKPYQFALDSGASYSCVSHEVVAELGLKEGPKFPMNSSDHEMGAMTKFATFEVAGKQVNGMSAVSAGFLADLSKRIKCKVDGVIGRNFWSQFIMTIDYPHRRIKFD